MVTASTVGKQHIFRGDDRLQMLQAGLMEVAEIYKWSIQAWAIFSNHYHFIAKSPYDATTLKKLIQHLHSQTSRTVNRLDNMSRRQVWFQYWDICLTFEKSYYARLNYVNNNPVKHGLVDNAIRYSFCSAAWFKDHTDTLLRRKIESVPYNQIDLPDDFTPVG
jgi:putative transposase